MKNKKKKRSSNKKVAAYIKTRTGLVFLVVLGLMCILVGRIIYINRNSGDDYYRKILSQLSYSAKEIPAERGEIYDRNGIVLAYNENQYILILEPKNILANDPNQVNLEATLDALCFVFSEELDREELKQKILAKPDSYYMRLLTKIPEDKKDAFEAYKEEYNHPSSEVLKAEQEAYDKEHPIVEEEEDGFLDKLKAMLGGSDKKKSGYKRGKVLGCYFEISQKRTYPGKEFASSTIGFANNGGGVIGLEAQYDDILKGKNGRKYGYLNQDSTVEVQTVQEEDGKKLVTTLDYYIQEVCEKLIKEYDTNVGSKTVAIMAMNPNNGEIYAMAHSGMFDLNTASSHEGLVSDDEWEKMTDKEKSDVLVRKWQNFCISASYEPGSTAKTFTIAAGIEENLMDREQTFYCDGSGKYNGCLIHCHKTSGHGTVDVTGALMASCNDALMQMAVNYISKESFCEYQEKFNIGSKTGIDLPDEQSCALQVYHADKMTDVDLATNSFGQNYFVTMVQMCAAYSSIVNGGYYYQPHVVKQILDRDGNVEENITPTLVRQTVSSQTSEFLKEALFQVVENGTGNPVRIDGYEVGGKTGTSEKQDVGGKEAYTISFMSVAPAYNPEIVLYTVVDEPHVSKAENTLQAKGLTKAALKQILPYLGVFPSNDDDASDKFGNFTSEDEDEMYDGDGSFILNPDQVNAAAALNPAE